jgi:hypothetical protein
MKRETNATNLEPSHGRAIILAIRSGDDRENAHEVSTPRAAFLYWLLLRRSRLGESRGRDKQAGGQPG